MSKRSLTILVPLLLAVLILPTWSAPRLSIAALLSNSVLPQVEAAAANQSQASAPALPQAQDAPPVLSSEAVLGAIQDTLGQIYENVNPSVVNIQVVQSSDGTASGVPETPGLPFDPSIPGQQLPRQGLGSGFVWDKEGHIITNNHVVEGADKITVIFHDDTSVPAEVVGSDPDSDLAVLVVDLPADQLQPVEVADSDDVKVGQLAVAIGNPYGLEGTMTVGFVSAVGRSLPAGPETMAQASYTIPDIIQTDAPINPGNSGGVLVNDAGQVIGVTAAIESTSGANAGIGFAVPSAIVQRVVPVLIENGKYEHAWLGISGRSLSTEPAQAMDLDANQRGVLIGEVTSGGPADKAGLRGSAREVTLDGQPVQVGGDVIVAIDGQPVGEFDDLVSYLAGNTSVGDTVTLTILRDGKEQQVQVTLAARPTEQGQQAQAQPQGQPQPSVAGSAWLGIQGVTVSLEIAQAMDLDADQQGVLVAEVVQGGPADEAGLRSGEESLQLGGETVQVGGDIIIAADGYPVAQMEDLLTFLQEAKVGQKVRLSLLRNGDEISLTVTLGERPASMQ